MGPSAASRLQLVGGWHSRNRVHPRARASKAVSGRMYPCAQSTRGRLEGDGVVACGMYASGGEGMQRAASGCMGKYGQGLGGQCNEPVVWADQCGVHAG